MRLIDADVAVENIEEWLNSVGTALIGKGLSYTGELMGCIEDAPTIDAVPVRHGHWIDTGFVNSTGKIFLCSECNHNHNPNKKDVAAGRVEERPKHCPGCGAKMDLEG